MTLKKTDILTTPKGQVVVLSDGKKYKLAPLNLNTIAELEEAFDCGIDVLESKLTETAVTLRKLLWVFLQEEYPYLTLKDVGKLIVLKDMERILKDVLSALDSLRV